MYTLLWLDFTDSRRSKDVVQLVGPGMPFNRVNFPGCSFVRMLGEYEQQNSAERYRQILWDTLEEIPLSFEEAFVILVRPPTTGKVVDMRSYRSLKRILHHYRTGI